MIDKIILGNAIDALRTPMKQAEKHKENMPAFVTSSGCDPRRDIKEAILAIEKDDGLESWKRCEVWNDYFLSKLEKRYARLFRFSVGGISESPNE